MVPTSMVQDSRGVVCGRYWGLKVVPDGTSYSLVHTLLL